MFRMIQKTVLAIMILLAGTNNQSFAAAGDTIAVQVFQNQDVVTAGGSNKYYKWGQFPAPSVSYNKVIMYLTFQCPDTMNCAEWDYLDPISIRRINGFNGDTLNWEFARFITPYGNYWGAGSSFKHGWYYDVTDFSTLLHDSVEIVYDHTGYETNTVGWKINMTFYFIEGTPEKEVKNITPIYQGGYGYNSNIETNLSAQTLTYGANTENARIKIIQSGHGMNDQNCSEFCPKQRWVKYDGTTVNQRMMWRECGFNSLFPQAGTWLYDRGNWCPGASVRYDDIDIANVAPNSTHSFDIDMEAVGAGNYGTQVITAYVVEYGAPNYTTDVSLESIIAPGNDYESLRMNPICGEPIIVIKNNGTAPLTSLNIVYGVPGGVQSTYQWTGNLPYLGVDTVHITQAVNWAPNSNRFQVDLQSPNGNTDENLHNNFSVSTFTSPDVVNVNEIVILFKSNKSPSENSYRLVNMTTGAVVIQKLSFSGINTTYKDTVSLNSGHCYSFEFYDDGPSMSSSGLNKNGLNWWADTSAGSGFVRLTKLNSIAVKNFNPDFGTKILYQFMCQFPLAINEVSSQEISMIVSPNPSTDGTITVNYTLPERNGSLEIYNMVGMKIYSEKLDNSFGESIISLKDMPKGIYLVKVITPGKLVQTQKVVFN